MKKAGHPIKLLDNQPKINVYELHILNAARTCETVSDIVAWGKLNKVSNLIDFTDLVLYARGRMVKNAKHKHRNSSNRGNKGG